MEKDVKEEILQKKKVISLLFLKLLGSIGGDASEKLGDTSQWCCPSVSFVQNP